MRVTVIIPCRGGSEGVKKKNIAKLAGVPLLDYTVTHAKRSNLVDTIVVSTEDAEIKAVAQSLDVVVIDRPDDLAHADVMPWEAVRHAAEMFHSDLFVELHTTYPFRTPELIDRAIETLSGADCVMVGSRIYDRVFRKAPGGGFYRLAPDMEIKRRQEMEPLYRDHYGLVNVYTPRCRLEGNPYQSTMELCLTDDARCTFDIDTPEDMETAEKMIGEFFASFVADDDLIRHHIPCGL